MACPTQLYGRDEKSVQNKNFPFTCCAQRVIPGNACRELDILLIVALPVMLKGKESVERSWELDDHQMFVVIGVIKEEDYRPLLAFFLSAKKYLAMDSLGT